MGLGLGFQIEGLSLGFRVYQGPPRTLCRALRCLFKTRGGGSRWCLCLGFRVYTVYRANRVYRAYKRLMGFIGFRVLEFRAKFRGLGHTIPQAPLKP